MLVAMVLGQAFLSTRNAELLTWQVLFAELHMLDIVRPED